ncbi:DUF2577 family protein [Anaerotignum sp. MB30-C6]|uniref:DUF2577 family protein n=1 Tax=Anaerotignum sp. MB30-C6 TaxID=3070814 RepID=UPI0027DE7387|nr:DUF2577 family protein [Anaerotignum sp. MB30-C6]WMI80897.1 DUF2577 family protein [Anaerotignum sp. MB30-C6]
MDPYVELATEFKKRDNPSIQGITIGTVLSPPPNLVINVNGFVLDKGQLVVADYLLSGYKRRTMHTVEVSREIIGSTHEHTHTVTIPDETFTDTLRTGDRMIVVASADNEIYYVLSKVGVL